ncbi:hypothetical protein FACS1894111_09110 [Clostridia bacterium]|nr:hypothetical protein FACS1894111_09110 [Clostridia bacterium]
MRVLGLEMKKIINSYAIWGFLLVCILFNVVLILSIGIDPYADYVKKVSVHTGLQLGERFNQKLTAFVQGENLKNDNSEQLVSETNETETNFLQNEDQKQYNQEQLASETNETEANLSQKESQKWRNSEQFYQESLIQETTEVSDVFDGYDTGKIADTYVQTFRLKGKLAENMRNKYADLQKIADEKGKHDDSLSLYFAGSTYGQHHKLFFSVMRSIIIEGVLLSVLIVLFSIGYENSNRIEDIVYSSKAGRPIVMKKLIAVVVTGIFFYLLLLGASLGLYFSVNDYSGIWQSNVSSSFNGIGDIIMGFRPFLTWHNFTVLSYLFATIGVSLILILCFSLMGFVAGICIRNSYVGFFALFFVNALLVTVTAILPPDSYFLFTLMLSPICLLIKQPVWFTDGGFDILWKNFEIRGVGASVVVMAIIVVVAAIKFRKREII